MISRRHGAATLVAALALTAGCGGGPDLLYEGRGDLTAVPIQVNLVKLTEQGLAPAKLELVSGEGGVAFLNDSLDKVVSIVFPNYEHSRPGCAFTTGFDREDGQTWTADPVGPQGLVSICVYEPGEHVYEVHGLLEDRPLLGKLVVSPGRGS